MLMHKFTLIFCLLLFSFSSLSFAKNVTLLGNIYNPGYLKPVDSVLNVKIGQQAPDFILQSTNGKKVRLHDFQGQKNVVLSFIPAAWTPVCSDQWPGYNISKSLFEKNNAVLLGLSVDNIPTLHAWTKQMGSLWFPVLSDFWPHGQVAELYGVLRGDGTAERALIFIDIKGVVRGIEVSDINVRPPLEVLVSQLTAMK